MFDPHDDLSEICGNVFASYFGLRRLTEAAPTVRGQRDIAACDAKLASLKSSGASKKEIAQCYIKRAYTKFAVDRGSSKDFFLHSYLASLRPIITDESGVVAGLQSPVDTMCVAGTKSQSERMENTLYINPKFVVDELASGVDIDSATENIIVVLLHEVLHIAYRHLIRFAHIPVNKVKLTKLVNVACDLAINHQLEKITKRSISKIGGLIPGVAKTESEKKLGLDLLPPNLSAEEYFERLLAIQKNRQTESGEESGEDGGDGGSGGGESGESGAGGDRSGEGGESGGGESGSEGEAPESGDDEGDGDGESGGKSGGEGSGEGASEEGDDDESGESGKSGEGGSETSSGTEGKGPKGHRTSATGQGGNSSGGKSGTGSATGSSATGTIEDMENSIDSKAIEEVSKTVERTGTIEQGKNADGSPMSEQDKMAQDKNAQKEIERKRETAQKTAKEAGKDGKDDDFFDSIVGHGYGGAANQSTTSGILKHELTTPEDLPWDEILAPIKAIAMRGAESYTTPTARGVAIATGRTIRDLENEEDIPYAPSTDRPVGLRPGYMDRFRSVYNKYTSGRGPSRSVIYPTVAMIVDTSGSMGSTFLKAFDHLAAIIGEFKINIRLYNIYSQSKEDEYVLIHPDNTEALSKDWKSYLEPGEFIPPENVKEIQVPEASQYGGKATIDDFIPGFSNFGSGGGTEVYPIVKRIHDADEEENGSNNEIKMKIVFTDAQLDEDELTAFKSPNLEIEIGQNPVFIFVVPDPSETKYFDPIYSVYNPTQEKNTGERYRFNGEIYHVVVNIYE